jgi:isopenicillin-N N-acyltransferase like protein
MDRNIFKNDFIYLVFYGFLMDITYFNLIWKDRPRKLAVAFLLVFLFAQCTIVHNIRQLSQFQKGDGKGTANISGAKLEYIGKYPVVHLYGTPGEMGRQYGTLLKPELNSLFSLMASVFPQKKLDGYIRQAKETEPFLPEEIKEELKAISEASGIDYDKIVTINVVPRIDCSTLAAWGESTSDHKMLMGRNSEYYTKGLNKVLGLIVVRHPDKGFKTINITFLGMVGTFTGINEKGVCYGNMLANNGMDDSIYVGGLPIQLLMRLGGEQSATPETFRDFLFGSKHIIPIIVMVAGAENAYVTEHTRDKSDFRVGEKSVLASANLFHTPGMVKEYKSDERYAILLNGARSNYGHLNVSLFEGIMEKASQKKKNVQCVVFKPSEMKMFVSINKVPASEGPFTTVDARMLFGE